MVASSLQAGCENEKGALGTLAYMECPVSVSHLIRDPSANQGQSQLSSSVIDSRLWEHREI